MIGSDTTYFSLDASEWKSDSLIESREKVYVIITDREMSDISGGPGIAKHRSTDNRAIFVRVSYLPVVEERFAGSPYLFDEPVVGTLTDHRGTDFTNIRFNYDLYKDVLVTHKDGRAVMLEPRHVKAFSFYDPGLDEKRYFENALSLPVESEELDQQSYFEILYAGPTTLFRKLSRDVYKKMDPNIQRAVLNDGTYTFSPIEEQLYLQKNDRLISIKAKRSSLLDALSEREEELLRIVRREGLKLNKIEDIRRLLSNYDQLNGMEDSG
ncbi:MAG: hypothetical protein R3350_07615 [Saprospiraceae bacterium]|nr:hypothetical protein [Saprospiraceae bacterium]